MVPYITLLRVSIQVLWFTCSLHQKVPVLLLVVGYALHVNPDPEHIPCYRVVNRLGEVSPAFAFGGGNRQIELLEADGIPCENGRVDLSRYQWERTTFEQMGRM